MPTRAVAERKKEIDTAKRMEGAYKTYVQHKKWAEAIGCANHLFNFNPKKNYGYLRGIRNRITRAENINDEERMRLLERTYLISARERFDDFMIAVEWNRPLKQKFWVPRRDKLLPVCNALQELEEGDLDELLLSLPPRVGKTTLVMFFTLWIMLRDPERSNLYCSYSDTVVAVFYSGLLEVLEDNDTYHWKNVFGERRVVGTNAKDRLINIDRMKRYASFTGRSLYGTLNGACDCNGYEIADDLISGIEEAMNKDRLMSAWSKVENNYLPRGKDGSKHLWIGTRWSLVDPAGKRLDLLQNDEHFKDVRWKLINVPALDKAGNSNFDYACGVGFSKETYEQRRASFERNSDMASWMAQYMGEPIERDGAVFSPEDLRYFNGELPLDIQPDRIFMAVDPAWGGGDYTAAPVVCQFDNDLYVVDVVFTDGDKNVSQPMLAKTIKKWNVQAVNVEATKTTSGYTEGLEKRLKDDGYHCNVNSSTSHYTGTGKQQRIFDKAPDIREHMVFLAPGYRSKDYEMFMNNVYSFSMTGKNKHDDAPDSLAMAINMVFWHNNAVTLVDRRSLGF